jgi:hypothetical protein
VRAGTLAWHLYARGGPHPVGWNQFRHYGPHQSRFDHHLAPPRVQTRGILYLAAEIVTCLAEVYQTARVITLRRHDPWLAAHRTTRDLVLLDLRGAWPTRAGASMALSTGPRARTRAWSAAIYEAYAGIDGLWYGSSMYRFAPCIALYERGHDSLPPSPALNRALADPALFHVVAAAADELRYLIEA